MYVGGFTMGNSSLSTSHSRITHRQQHPASADGMLAAASAEGDVHIYGLSCKEVVLHRD